MQQKSEFGKNPKGFMGLKPNCNKCAKVIASISKSNQSEESRQRRLAYSRNYNLEYYKTHAEKFKTNSSMQYFENKSDSHFIEKRKRYKQAWMSNNPDKVAEYSHKRRAKKLKLPNDLTSEVVTSIMEHFDHSCVLTGDKENLHLDHVIPLNIEEGGHVYWNVVPLRADLNMSKGHKNLFTWFYANKERFNLEQERFDDLIKYLASHFDESPEYYHMLTDAYFGNYKTKGATK